MTTYPSITAHCIVKNEEVFIGYAIRSVIDHVDSVIVFDTGSNDNTPNIIRNLTEEYPNKIVFEEKGLCDKVRHSELRQEMLDRTSTDWFMILDGDEVWTERGLNEALSLISQTSSLDCIISPFYLCVGDIFHRYYGKGSFSILDRQGHYLPRFFRCAPGLHWSGIYGEDAIVDSTGSIFMYPETTVFLENKFWHMTHLRRSSQDDADYSSGGSRWVKRRLTYFFIGRRIMERVPEVFVSAGSHFALSFSQSLIEFFRLIFLKMRI